MQAFKNFERLLCGSLDIPIILLQNQPKDNMLLSYDGMVAKTPDLQWPRDVLKIHGLKLDDIIIMDLFPMLNGTWLDNVNEQLHNKIFEDVCDLTLRILQTIKPSIIRAFQFSVGGSKELWQIQENMQGIKITNMMWDFSSARSRAKDIKISQVYFPEQTFHLIQAFRPTEIWRKKGDERLMMDHILAQIVREVYRPCGEWKSTMKSE